MANVFLENLKYRTQRETRIDPWNVRDNFRLNHQPLRELVVVDNNEKEVTYYVQYQSEDCFNVFRKDVNGFLVPIALDSVLKMSATRPDRLYVRDDNHQYQVNFFIDPSTEEVVQVDYEGAPLKFKKKIDRLEKERSDDKGEMKDHVKSPMPGTVVKVFVEVGQKVTAGQSLASIESMKMEYVIKATHDCVISKIDCKASQFVQ